MSQPALDVTPGPAQPVAVEVCLKIKIQSFICHQHLRIVN